MLLLVQDLCSFSARNRSREPSSSSAIESLPSFMVRLFCTLIVPLVSQASGCLLPPLYVDLAYVRVQRLSSDRVLIQHRVKSLAHDRVPKCLYFYGTLTDMRSMLQKRSHQHGRRLSTCQRCQTSRPLTRTLLYLSMLSLQLPAHPSFIELCCHQV